MSVMRLIAAAALAVAVEARAQEPAPAGAAPPAHDTPAASTGHESAPARKVPTVSRVAPPAPPAASTGHAGAGDHGPAAKPAGGYVTTGARKGGDGGHGSGRRKPVVSGMVAPDHAAPAHPSAEALPPSLTEHVTVVGTAPAAAGHDKPAAPASAVTARPRDAARPAKLSDVHERLRAALAGAKLDGSVAEPGGHEPAATAAPVRRTPRVSLAWPGPRWRLIWPAAGRVSVRWPEVEPWTPVPAVPVMPMAVPQH